MWLLTGAEVVEVTVSSTRKVSCEGAGVNFGWGSCIWTQRQATVVQTLFLHPNNELSLSVKRTGKNDTTEENMNKICSYCHYFCIQEQVDLFWSLCHHTYWSLELNLAPHPLLHLSGPQSFSGPKKKKYCTVTCHSHYMTQILVVTSCSDCTLSLNEDRVCSTPWPLNAEPPHHSQQTAPSKCYSTRLSDIHKQSAVDLKCLY